MRISDWSSDVCSSDLLIIGRLGIGLGIDRLDRLLVLSILAAVTPLRFAFLDAPGVRQHVVEKITRLRRRIDRPPEASATSFGNRPLWSMCACVRTRSDEHTSELQSLMRISYAVFCLKKKNQ